MQKRKIQEKTSHSVFVCNRIVQKITSLEILFLAIFSLQIQLCLFLHFSFFANSALYQNQPSTYFSLQIQFLAN